MCIFVFFSIYSFKIRNDFGGNYCSIIDIRSLFCTVRLALFRVSETVNIKFRFDTSL